VLVGIGRRGRAASGVIIIDERRGDKNPSYSATRGNVLEFYYTCISRDRSLESAAAVSSRAIYPENAIQQRISLYYIFFYLRADNFRGNIEIHNVLRYKVMHVRCTIINMQFM